MNPILLRCICLVDSLPRNFISLMRSAADSVSWLLQKTMNGLPSRHIRSSVIFGREENRDAVSASLSLMSVESGMASPEEVLNMFQLAVESS